MTAASLQTQSIAPMTEATRSSPRTHQFGSNAAYTKSVSSPTSALMPPMQGITGSTRLGLDIKELEVPLSMVKLLQA